jgi:hypothetical protein
LAARTAQKGQKPANKVNNARREYDNLIK